MKMTSQLEQSHVAFTLNKSVKHTSNSVTHTINF